MSNLKARLQEDMKTAMKAGEKARLQTIRSINAAIKQREVDERIELTDDQILALIDKQAKQRKDSLTQFEQADRQDLAEIERFELEVINGYLPQQLTDEEIDALIQEALAETGATDIKGMGQVMNLLKPKLTGRADMGKVGGKIKAALS